MIKFHPKNIKKFIQKYIFFYCKELIFKLFNDTINDINNSLYDINKDNISFLNKRFILYHGFKKIAKIIVDIHELCNDRLKPRDPISRISMFLIMYTHIGKYLPIFSPNNCKNIINFLFFG